MNKPFICAAALLFLYTASPAETVWTDVSNATEWTEAFTNHVEAIRITGDFTDDGQNAFLVDSPLMIDLNGHKVTLSNNIAVRGYNTLTIDDLSAAADGEMITTNKYLISAAAPGLITIRNGTFSNTGGFPIIYLSKYGNVTLEGGTLKCMSHGYAVENNGYFAIKGGRIIGFDGSLSPVFNNGEGVAEMTAGAVYAGNRTLAVCFDNAYWSSGDGDEEIAVTKLPEGVHDGGAIVLDQKWAIPGTKYINYHTDEGVSMEPATHYYTPGADFDLPGCDYKDGKPFAGWSKSATSTTGLITKVTADMNEDLELYPVWTYVGLSETLDITLTPQSISPEPDASLTELSQIVLAFGEECDGLYINESAESVGYVKNLLSGEVASEITLETDWDGNVTITLSTPVTANGTYQLFIPVNTIGNDEWYYSDMEEGRCNPDLMYNFKVYNRPTGTNNAVSDPESGSTVDKLDLIKIIFPDETDVLNNYSDNNITITDGLGNVVAEISSIDVGYAEDAGNAMVVPLPEPITAGGVYTMNVPESFFAFDWWERECSSLTFSWTIVDEAGIGSIAVGKDGKLEIFDLSGRKINATDIHDLVPGLYICNGRKVRVL